MSERDSWRRPLTAVLATAVGMWTVTVAVLAAAVGWLAGETELELRSRPVPGWVWLIVAGSGALLAGVPALLLASVPRAPSARAAGRAWALAAVLSGVLGALRALVPSPHHELYLLVLAVVAGVGALLLRPGRPHSDGAALTAGIAVLLPWLWLGALGGAVETVAAIVAAVAVGGLVAALLGPLWTVFGTGSKWWRIAVAGLVAGAALAPLAAAIGSAGTGLLALFVLPPLGFVAAALPRGRTVLFALAALGPLALVDPDELTLILGLRDEPFWAFVAAAGSLAVGLLISLWYALAGAPRRRFAAIAAAVAIAAAATVHIGLGHPGWHGDRLFVVLKSQADLSNLDGARPQRLRETYQRLTGTAERSQAPLREELSRLHVHYTPYYLVNAIEVDAGDWLHPWLERRSDVDRVLASPRLRPLPAAEPPLSGNEPEPDGPQWNVTMVGADKVWRDLGVTGAGIVVGSSDSGVDGTHPAVRDNFRGGDDSWYDPWNGTRTPTDHGGHGTHTLASAVGGHGVGIAPGAQWVGCVNLDRNLGNPAWYLNCLQFMLAPFPHGGDPWRDGRPERAPHILTNSWGCPPPEGCDTGALQQAVDALAAAGVYVVVGAGNSGPSCRTVEDPPATYRSALTVGAVGKERRVAEFSSRGPAPDGDQKPDVLAPGVAVLSALPGGKYGKLDGTSMATPQVAGVVALMWSANPALVGDIGRTTAILHSTATAVDYTGPTCGGTSANVTGAGIVDAYAAVRAARG